MPKQKQKDWSDRLEKLNKKWGAAKQEAAKTPDGFERMDDGRYVARLTGYTIGESQSGRFQLTTDFAVVQGDEKGQAIRRFDGLEKAESLPYVAKYLQRLGVDLEDFELTELDDVMKKLVEERPAVQLRLVTNGDFQNVYVDRIVETDDDVDEDEDGKDKDEVDLPEVGDTIKAEVDDEEVEGEVIKVDEDGKRVRIKDEDGKKHWVDQDDIQADEDGKDKDDDEPFIPEVGDIVNVEDDEGDTEECEVLKVKEEKEKVQVAMGKKEIPTWVALDKVSEIKDGKNDKDADTNAVEPKKGDRVYATYKKRECEGVIVKLDAKHGTVTVKLDKGKGTHEFKVDEVELDSK
jgi:hypothetical protein